MSLKPQTPPAPGRPGAPAAAAREGRSEVTPAAALAAGLPWEGSLAASSPIHLHYLAAAAQASGRLRFAAGQVQLALTFRRGNVEHAASTDPADDLGALLVRRGLVRREAVEAARSGPAGAAIDLIGALVAARWLDAAACFPILQEHGIAVVARALALEQGAARFEPGVPPPPSSFQLGPRWAVLCAAVRRIDAAAAGRLLGRRAHQLASRSGGRVELEALALTAQEARVAGLLDGRSSPAELAARQPADAELILRVALLLAETELLQFGAERPAPAAATPAPPKLPSPPPQAASRPPSPPREEGQGGAVTPTTRPATARPPTSPPAAPPPAPRPVSRPPPKDLGQLRAFHDQLAKADHFEALGVKPDTAPAQVKIAYFKLAKQYHPDAAPPGEGPEARQLRIDIFARIGEAWGVLGDEKKRAEYLDRQLAGAVDVDVMAILQAENVFQAATALVKNRRYEEAGAKLDEALALNAEEPEFHVWKAWVQFLLAADKKRQREASSTAIEAALKKAPRCMPAYLFLGQMAKLTGDAVAAERCYKRGLAVDPEQTELQRELKYLRK